MSCVIEHHQIVAWSTPAAVCSGLHLEKGRTCCSQPYTCCNCSIRRSKAGSPAPHTTDASARCAAQVFDSHRGPTQCGAQVAQGMAAWRRLPHSSPAQLSWGASANKATSLGGSHPPRPAATRCVLQPSLPALPWHDAGCPWQTQSVATDGEPTRTPPPSTQHVLHPSEGGLKLRALLPLCCLGQPLVAQPASLVATNHRRVSAQAQQTHLRERKGTSCALLHIATAPQPFTRLCSGWVTPHRPGYLLPCAAHRSRAEKGKGGVHVPAPGACAHVFTQ